jgi:hypothetical protein
MIASGKVYFWRFLERCDPLQLEGIAEVFRSEVSRVMGQEYSVVQPDHSGRERIRRWSEGAFNGPGEHNLKFPRVLYVLQNSSGNTNERWIMDVFFTRIPHIRGLYHNRINQHRLPPRKEQSLSKSCVESHIADVFIRDTSFAGNVPGLYLFHKLRNIGPLKDCAESSRYTPPESDLKQLLASLSTFLGEDNNSSGATEIPSSAKSIRAFLESCDRRLIKCLGDEAFQKILEPVDTPLRTWLSGGKRSLFRWF